MELYGFQQAQWLMNHPHNSCPEIKARLVINMDILTILTFSYKVVLQKPIPYRPKSDARRAMPCMQACT